MGKKTNWTVSEDQALCRAWMNASDTGYAPGSDQKAATFWNAVHSFFHQELETSIDRPLNGLKIRWTRINRDVQKFALCFAQVITEQEQEQGDQKEEITQEMIEQAKELYHKEQGTKFLFEICWKLLRLHPKWIQLLTSSTNGTTMSTSSHTLGTIKSHHHQQQQQQQLGVQEATVTATLAAGQKRRHPMMEYTTVVAPSLPPHTTATTTTSLRDLTQLLRQEMSRRNELLEEQNAIHLFTNNLDEDEDVQKYFTLLKQKYLKKIKLTLLNQESTSTAAPTSTTTNYI